ncbi:MAG: hypothetical protein ACUVQI_02840 [Thermochromatium sp.]
MREQVARLAEQGVRFHALGLGTPGGATVPAPQGGVIVDPNDPQRRAVRSVLNEALLEGLAQVGGGIYRRADYRDGDTKAILEAATVSRLPPEASDVRTRVWNERYWILVLLVGVLLLPQLRELAYRPAR